MIPGAPFREGGYSVWKDRLGDVEVRFTGRGPSNEREEILQSIAPNSPPVAWAKQIHSAVALPARPGFCGEGDALFADGGTGLALSVVTADCVPILIAGSEEIAAVHAGWRGIVGGVIAATLKRMRGRPGDWTAWIGPAIGSCCYEVGEDVAAQVVAASAPEVATRGPSGKPHLDLAQAARLQLEAAGVGEVRLLSPCTRCHEELWSYRREWRGGRNLGFIWRRSG